MVVYHHCPVIIRRREDSPKLLKGGDRVKGYPICIDRHLCPLPRLLLCQEVTLPFLPPA